MDENEYREQRDFYRSLVETPFILRESEKYELTEKEAKSAFDAILAHYVADCMPSVVENLGFVSMDPQMPEILMDYAMENALGFFSSELFRLYVLEWVSNRLSSDTMILKNPNYQ